MTVRAYTLAEIDRLRTAIIDRDGCGVSYQCREERTVRYVEEQLRTAMFGGVSPDDPPTHPNYESAPNPSSEMLEAGLAVLKASGIADDYLEADSLVVAEIWRAMWRHWKATDQGHPPLTQGVAP